MNKRIIPALLSLSATGLVSIAVYEGYRSVAYKDQAGVPTVGFGTTVGVGHDTTTDPVRALIRLRDDANEVERRIKECIGDVPLAPYEFDAFVSLAYNIGTGAFCSSTLVKKLKQHPPDYEGACAEILRWVYVGKNVSQGLVNRRRAEYAMCLGDV